MKILKISKTKEESEFLNPTSLSELNPSCIPKEIETILTFLKENKLPVVIVLNYNVQKGEHNVFIKDCINSKIMADIAGSGQSQTELTR